MRTMEVNDRCVRQERDLLRRVVERQQELIRSQELLIGVYQNKIDAMLDKKDPRDETLVIHLKPDSDIGTKEDPYILEDDDE